MDKNEKLAVARKKVRQLQDSVKVETAWTKHICLRAVEEISGQELSPVKEGGRWQFRTAQVGRTRHQSIFNRGECVRIHTSQY